MKILSIAIRDGSCTAEGLMAELGISRSTLGGHIKPLEEAGLLVPSTDPTRSSARGGSNRLVWAVDREALDRILDELRRSITGENSQD